ncbi:hypothetical protein QN363_19605, partial [Undibacterium sp. CCC2.1]|nr:hypothetical protein [Undibacterium sp. CCC2.1]MEB0174293.1 hypothetical protein [Undibacterium sp. CCC1.1]MEB0178237.1 hypothetical protein [Undibacterium sp. CCC3.4]MEB0217436.1 hypothetical protein [Undibacterium sp. 5I2]
PPKRLKQFLFERRRNPCPLGRRGCQTTLLSALSSAEQILARPINPTQFTVAEFRKRQQEQQHFLMRVLEQEKLFLIGDEDVLRRLGESAQDS